MDMMFHLSKNTLSAQATKESSTFQLYHSHMLKVRVFKMKVMNV